MARIEDHKYSIEEAFRECFYIVPDYQREYVWTEKEVQHTGEHREYFIGTVLVSPTQQKNHFEVIDGQQRLTTFFLLLCALRQRFKGEPQYPVFSSLLATSYTDSGGNLKTSLKLEPKYEHAGDLINRVVGIGDDPQTTRAKITAAGIPHWLARKPTECPQHRPHLSGQQLQGCCHTTTVLGLSGEQCSVHSDIDGCEQRAQDFRDNQ